MNSAVHVAALSALIYSFRPSIASEFYEMKATEYASISLGELDEM